MTNPADSPVMICCGRDMQELASAERSGHAGGVHRVIVYRCETCGRTDAKGQSCDPWWVSAKARMFLELRSEAFGRAELEADPAFAIFDNARQVVIFGSLDSH